jgi:uncharacterized protein YbjT (DUF2867 family)
MGRGDRPSNFRGNWHTYPQGQSDLEIALAHQRSVVHCATSITDPARDLDTLQSLIDASRTQGVHIAFPSIAGAENAAAHMKYYRMKADAEAMLRESGVPHTVVRCTYFHEFVDFMLRKLSIGRILVLPAVRWQPLDVDFAAECLTAAAIDRIGGTIQVHGPETLSAGGLLAAWRPTHSKPKLRLPFPAIGPLRALHLIEPAYGRAGGKTWQDWNERRGVAQGHTVPG